jgi:ribA/ribD-fused uncharacterized protein
MTREYIYFFSKSKGALERRLSNFYPARVEYKGVVFPSIENAFQAAKYECSSKPDVFRDLARAEMTPAMAKSAGSKTGMKKRGAVLDVAKWNDQSVAIMKRLVKSRMKTDDLYRKTILLARKQGLPIYHFERSCAKSFWGGCFRKGEAHLAKNFVGENMLGKILGGKV